MTTQLFISRNGALLTNNSLNLTAGNDYRIDDVPVINANSLGVTVTTSNLKQLGTLNTLAVSGDAVLGEFAFFDTTFNRLGLGTEDPSHSLSIIDNNVEIGLGSPDFNHAEFGTYSNHTLTLVTDGAARVVINNNGTVNFNHDVTVAGTLTVNSLITDTRVTKTSPIEFLPTTDSGVYGLGMVWSGKDYQRQFVLRDPDRIWSTNSIDLADEQAYYINGRSVLNATKLGPSVTESSLVTVGTLQELTVAGSAVFQSAITAPNSDFILKSISAQNENGNLYITPGSISSNIDLYINTGANTVLSATGSSISIGTSDNPIPVKIANQLAVNVNNPDPNFKLEVNGPVKLNGKRFVSGYDAPTQGDFNQGDICWNNNPSDNSYVGWVCTVTGSPGIWQPFGAIGHR